MSWFLFKQIKKYILNYNKHVTIKLLRINTHRKAMRQEHQAWFNQLNDTEQRQETARIARDAAYSSVVNDSNLEEYESDLYNKLHHLEIERSNINVPPAALTYYIPLVAAISSAIMIAHVTFQRSEANQSQPFTYRKPPNHRSIRNINLDNSLRFSPRATSQSSRSINISVILLDAVIYCSWLRVQSRL